MLLPIKIDRRGGVQAVFPWYVLGYHLECSETLGVIEVIEDGI
jgi:hypothetical protein